jgi:hypothetical protein
MTRSLSIHDGFARFSEAHFSASKTHSTLGPERRQEHLRLSWLQVHALEQVCEADIRAHRI